MRPTRQNPMSTPRLVLREYEMTDVQAVWLSQRSPEISRYTGDGGVKTVEEIASILERVIVEYDERGFGRWALIHRADTKIIGFAGLKFLPERNEVDLGYRMSPEYWGQGLATEAGRAVMQYAWQTLKLKTVMAMVMPENTASSRVLLKLGFEFAGSEIDDGTEVEVYRATRPAD